MIDVDGLVQDAWRYLGLPPYEVYRTTHRDLILILQANNERMHDQREEQAAYAIFNAVASRGKGKKGTMFTPAEIYSRDKVEEKPTETVEDILEQQKQAMEWLSNFNISSQVKTGEEDE